MQKFCAFLLFFLLSIGNIFGQDPATIVPSYEWLDDANLPDVTVDDLNAEDITIAIAVDSRGFVYTLSFGNGVDKRDADGNVISKIIQPNQLDSPLDIAINSEDLIFIADYSQSGSCSDNGKIKVFGQNGQQISNRTILTQYYRPIGLDIDSDDNVYVAEYNEENSGCENDELSRVRLYKQDGTVLTNNSDINQPFRIAVDSRKNLFVSQGDGKVLMLNQNLTLIKSLSNLQSPAGLAVDSFDYLHVLEYANRVNFEDFINYDDLSAGDLFTIAGDIRNGIRNEDFVIKIFDPNQVYKKFIVEKIDFPFDLEFNSCDRMYVDNCDVDGFSTFFGFVPTALRFDLEIYERTPAFDEEAPIITCPPSNSFDIAEGQSTATITYAEPTVSDNNTYTLERTAGPASGSQQTADTYSITYTATDVCGNESECTFQIVVNAPDEEPTLVITCVANKDVNLTDDQPVTVLAGDLLSSDTSGLTFNPASFEFDCSDIGTQNITINATDDETGATDSCVVSISVRDIAKPVITNCSTEERPVSLREGETYTIPDYRNEISFSDDCDSDLEYSQVPEIGEEITETKTVTITVTDDGGLKAECSFDIVITNEPEDTPPEFTNCPDDIIQNNDTGQCGAVATFNTPTVTDDSGTIIPNRIDGSGLNSGDEFPVGNTTITFQADDGVNDPVICSFTITVSDNEAPQFLNCPAQDITISLNEGEIYTIPDYRNEISFSDNCDSDQSYSQDPAIGDQITETTTVSLTIADYSGLQAECSFDIIITEEPVDTPPEFTNCPDDIIQNNDPDQCGAVVTFNTPTVTDDSGSITPTRIDGTGLNSGDEFPLGNTTISFQADDGVNDPVICSFTIIVSDNEAPQFLNCPTQNTTISLDEGETHTIIDYRTQINYQDNCDSDLAYSQVPAIGEVITETTTVTVTITDDAGLQEECSFDIIITDEPVDTPPEFTDCPENIIQNNDSGQCGSVVTFNTPTVTDDSGSIIPTRIDGSGLNSGDEFPVGNTTITFQADDGVNDPVICSFTITVSDNEDPVITECPVDEEISITEGTSSNLLDYTDQVVATDNCNNLIITQQPAPDTPIDEDTEVEITVTDAAGNTDSCIFNLKVTVVDEDELIINCPAEKELFLNSNCEYLIPDFSNLVDTTIEGAVISQSIPANTAIGFDSESFVTVTATYEDQTDSCDILLSYNTETELLIECPADKTAMLAEGETFMIPDYRNELNIADSCGEINIVQTPAPNTPVNTNTQINFVITDAFGNPASCDFQLNFVDEGSLIINCPADKILAWDENCSFVLPDFTDEADVMNGEGLNVVQEPAPGTIITDDNVEITFSVADGENTATCNFNVTLRDETPPLLLLQDISVSLDSDASAIISFEDIDAGSYDNCDGQVQYDLSKVSFSCKNLGANTVQVTAEDNNGNISTASVTIRVNDNSGFCEEPGIGTEYIFIYPNPNTGSFKVATPADVVIERLEIFDHRGRFIIAKDYETTVSEYAIEFGPLQEAIYVVKIITSDGVVIRRMIFKY